VARMDREPVGQASAFDSGRLHPTGVSIGRRLKRSHAPGDSRSHRRSREIFIGCGRLNDGPKQLTDYRCYPL